MSDLITSSNGMSFFSGISYRKYIFTSLFLRFFSCTDRQNCPGQGFFIMSPSSHFYFLILDPIRINMKSENFITIVFILVILPEGWSLNPLAPFSSESWTSKSTKSPTYDNACEAYKLQASYFRRYVRRWVDLIQSAQDVGVTETSFDLNVTVSNFLSTAVLHTLSTFVNGQSLVTDSTDIAWQLYEVEVILNSFVDSVGQGLQPRLSPNSYGILVLLKSLEESLVLIPMLLMMMLAFAFLYRIPVWRILVALLCTLWGFQWSASNHESVLEANARICQLLKSKNGVFANLKSIFKPKKVLAIDCELLSRMADKFIIWRTYPAKIFRFDIKSKKFFVHYLSFLFFIFF